jgi:hypothetical protein
MGVIGDSVRSSSCQHNVGGLFGEFRLLCRSASDCVKHSLLNCVAGLACNDGVEYTHVHGHFGPYIALRNPVVFLVA